MTGALQAPPPSRDLMENLDHLRGPSELCKLPPKEQQPNNLEGPSLESRSPAGLPGRPEDNLRDQHNARRLFCSFSWMSNLRHEEVKATPQQGRMMAIASECCSKERGEPELIQSCSFWRSLSHGERILSIRAMG